MSGERRRYNVGVVKIPHAQRDVARDVLGDTGAERGFFDILGADTPDDHDEWPVGADCAYTVDLTDDEAGRFRAASNCRYVTPEGPVAVPCSPSTVPALHSRAWVRQTTFDGSDTWHGRNVNVAILDSGTTPAVRNYMSWTLVGRSYANVEDPPPSGSIYPNAEHGSLVASAGIPAGGRLLDYNITGRDFNATPGWIAAGIRWACQNGAKVINISHGLTSANNQQAPVVDAINYMGGFDTVLFASAGNNSSSSFLYPAAFAFSYSHVHGLMSFDEAAGTLASTSNYTTNRAAGVAPGNPLRGVGPSGAEVDWYGTSAASPLASSCVTRMLTKGTLTAKQCSTALKGNFRNLGLSRQGGGGYDMQAALTALGAFDRPRVVSSSWLGMW